MKCRHHYCDNPVEDPRKGKLCAHHLRKRDERRRETAKMPKCTRCGSVAQKGHTLCSRHIAEVQEEEAREEARGRRWTVLSKVESATDFEELRAATHEALEFMMEEVLDQP